MNGMYAWLDGKHGLVDAAIPLEARSLRLFLRQAFSGAGAIPQRNTTGKKSITSTSVAASTARLTSAPPTSAVIVGTAPIPDGDRCSRVS
jgi:hypothetical protein